MKPIVTSSAGTSRKTPRRQYAVMLVPSKEKPLFANTETEDLGTSAEKASKWPRRRDAEVVLARYQLKYPNQYPHALILPIDPQPNQNETPPTH
jgi:hypothetical protein